MTYPITSAEVGNHLRLGTLSAAEQEEIDRMIAAATEYAESFCNRPWVAGSASTSFSTFPYNAGLPLKFYGSAGTISAIDYHDASGSIRNMVNYRLMTRGGVTSVYPLFGTQWPSDCGNEAYNITIHYTIAVAGGVPASVKAALLLLVGDMYENRENSVTGQGVTHVRMTLTAERLLTPYKTRVA